MSSVHGQNKNEDFFINENDNNQVTQFVFWETNLRYITYHIL